MKRNQSRAILFWGLALLILFAICPLKGANNLYDSVIRIHVIANSDEEEDQEMKLLVRDEILSFAEENLSCFEDQKVAAEVLETELDEIETLAKSVLEEKGVDLPVSVALEKEYYPTRNYDALSLPAGEYLSLQVKIGKAQGKNWWCMLFPPTCLGSALDAEETLLSGGMNEENAKTVIRDGKGYKIRFKVLELWSSAREKFKAIF